MTGHGSDSSGSIARMSGWSSRRWGGPWSTRRATESWRASTARSAAVRAAIGIGEVADRLGIKTRAGVHTGEVELSAEALTGLAVHIGAKVLAEAGPGEVVVTATTHDLTADAGIGYESRGSVELRGVSGLRQLYAVRPR